MNARPFALRLSLCLLLTPALSLTAAEKRVCPDLATASQVGNCPSEADLKYTFNGFCSDDRRMYTGDTEVCTDYQAYRRLKNVAPWESAAGDFMAYVSCELPAARIQTLRAQGVTVSRAAQITLLTCDYGEGIRFTHRSRLSCKVEGDGNCANGAQPCRAVCE